MYMNNKYRMFSTPTGCFVKVWRENGKELSNCEIDESFIDVIWNSEDLILKKKGLQFFLESLLERGW